MNLSLILSLSLWALLSWRGGLMPVQAPLGAGLALVLLAVQRPRRGAVWHPTRLESGLGALILVFGVLAVTGTRPQQGLDQAVVLACLWVLGLGWRRQRQWAEPVAALWLSLSVLAGLAFFAAGWLGQARWPSDLVGPLLRPYLSSRWVSPNENILGGTLSGPGLLLGLALLVEGSGGLRRALAWSAVGLGAAACVYAGSRGVWLGLAVASAWLWLRWPAGGRGRLGLALLGLFLALGLGVMQAPFSTSRLRHQLQENPAQADSNAGRRLDFWRGALRLSLEHPWTGWGPASFRLQAQRLDLPTALDEKHPIARYRLVLEHAHDEWLELAVETGWPFALAALGLAGAWLWRRWRRGARDGLSLGMEAGVVLALVLSLTDMDLRTPGPLLGLVLVVAVLDPVEGGFSIWTWPAWLGPCLGALMVALCLGWWQREALEAAIQAQRQPSPWVWASAEDLAPLDGKLAAWRQDFGRPPRPWDAWTGRAEPKWWWSCSAQAGRAKDYALSLQDSQHALALHPFDAPGWFLLALRLQALGRVPEASLAVRHALQLEPNYCRALAWACDRAWALGDRETARRDYQAILRSSHLVLVQDTMDDLSRAVQAVDPTWLKSRARRFR